MQNSTSQPLPSTLNAIAIQNALSTPQRSYLPTTPSVSPMPCPDGLSCSSHSCPSQRTSGPRTRSTSPNLCVLLSASGISSSSHASPFKTTIGGNLYLPKTVDPRLSTNFPSVRPWKRIASLPGPSQYPNVHTAWADLSSKPESILWRFGAPRESMNHLLAG